MFNVRVNNNKQGSGGYASFCFLRSDKNFFLKSFRDKVVLIRLKQFISSPVGIVEVDEINVRFHIHIRFRCMPLHIKEVEINIVAGFNVKLTLRYEVVNVCASTLPAVDAA